MKSSLKLAAIIPQWEINSLSVRIRLDASWSKGHKKNPAALWNRVVLETYLWPFVYLRRITRDLSLNTNAEPNCERKFSTCTLKATLRTHETRRSSCGGKEHHELAIWRHSHGASTATEESTRQGSKDRVSHLPSPPGINLSAQLLAASSSLKNGSLCNGAVWSRFNFPLLLSPICIFSAAQVEGRPWAVLCMGQKSHFPKDLLINLENQWSQRDYRKNIN